MLIKQSLKATFSSVLCIRIQCNASKREKHGKFSPNLCIELRSNEICVFHPSKSVQSSCNNGLDRISFTTTNMKIILSICPAFCQSSLFFNIVHPLFQSTLLDDSILILPPAKKVPYYILIPWAAVFPNWRSLLKEVKRQKLLKITEEQGEKSILGRRGSHWIQISFSLQMHERNRLFRGGSFINPFFSGGGQ